MKASKMIIYSIQHLPKKTVFTKTEYITVCDMLHIDGGNAFHKTDL